MRRAHGLLVSVVIAAGAVGAGVPRAQATPSHGLLAHGSIVGDPREDVGAIVDAGVVYVFPEVDDAHVEETASGSIAITEATIGVTPQAGDLFGASVLQADTNSDGMKDLIIGAPGRNHGAGVVYVIRATSDGTTYDFAHPVVLQQGSGGVAGTSEAGDGFGATIVIGSPYNVPWFAIGVPGEDVGSVVDAGDVVIMPLNLDGAQSLTVYAGHGAPGVPQAGDRFGAALSPDVYGLAVGVPGHNVGAAVGAGQVDLLGPELSGNGFPGAGANSVIVQGAARVPGTPGSGNQFGAALTEPQFGQLAIGAPGQTVAGVAHVGSVTVVPSLGAGVFTTFTPGVGGFPGRLQPYAHFGAALFASHDGTFFAGAPDANVGSIARAGLVFALPTNGSDLGYDAADATVFDESALHQGITAGDGFGAVIGAGSRIAFGLPRKTVNGVADVGEVVFVDSYAPHTSLTVQQFVQGRGGVPGTAEAGDAMGGALPAI